MATVDLFTLLFQDILQISPSLLYKYTTIQDQIFNLIFLPHVILFLFLYGFGMMLAPETGNVGLRRLVTITAYIFIVYQGWYGTFLIPLMQTWFTIMLVFGLALFLISRIVHPFTARTIGKTVGSAVGKEAGKQLGKGKALAALNKELDNSEKELNRTKSRLNAVSAQGNPFEHARLLAKKAELEEKIRLLKIEIQKY